MSHWFDDIAIRASRTESERLMTRRETVKAAAGAAGLAAVGALGSPLITGAWAQNRCQCQARADRAFGHYLGGLNREFLRGGWLTGGGTVAYILGVAGGCAGRTAAYVDCAANVPRQGCDDDPTIGKAPPADEQPCLARGGHNWRDQCGGEVTTPPGGSGCGPGTTSCSDGSGLCCFGSDLCCAGCCCIAEVGCTCCG
jgi:hypothetical protein